MEQVRVVFRLELRSPIVADEAVFVSLLPVHLPWRPARGDEVKVRVGGGVLGGIVTGVSLTEGRDLPDIIITLSKSESKDFDRTVERLLDARWKRDPPA